MRSCLRSSFLRSCHPIAVALVLASAMLPGAPASAASIAVGDVVQLRQSFATTEATLYDVAGDGATRDEIESFGDSVGGGTAFETQNQLLVAGTLPVELEPGLYEFVPALLRVNVASETAQLVSRDGFLRSSSAVAFGPQGAVIGSDSAVALVNPYNGQQSLVTAGAGLASVLALAVGDDGTIYALRGTGSGPATVVAIDPGTGAETLLAAGGVVDRFTDITLGTDGNLVAVGLLDPPAPLQTREGGVFGIDVATGDVSLLFSGGALDLPDPLGSVQGSNASQVAVGPDGTVFVAGNWCFPGGCFGSPQGPIIAIDPSTGAQQPLLTGGGYVRDLAAVPIPEPGTLALLSLGLAALRVQRRALD